MEREIVRLSEGFWKITDEFGKEILKFKLDDEISFGMISYKIKAVSFLKEDTILSLTNLSETLYFRMSIHDLELLKI